MHGQAAFPGVAQRRKTLQPVRNTGSLQPSGPLPPEIAPSSLTLPLSAATLPRALLRALLLALAYFVAGRVGLSLAFVQANASPVWPPSGVALAGLLLMGRRYWPAVYVAAVAVTLTTGVPLRYAMLAGVGNVLDAVIGAWLLGPVWRIRTSLAGVRDVLRFVPLASLPGPAASALFGVGGLLVWGMLPWERAPATALVWWTGNGTGVLVAAPLILAWAAARRPPSRRQSLELACAVAGAVLVTVLAFHGRGGWYGASVPLSYAVFPFVTWAAMRMGLRGAATVTAAVAFAGVARAARVIESPLGAAEAQQALLFVQAYLALVSVTGLVLAALTHERRRALRRERRARRNAQAAERRSAFLAEVGAVLSGSLDHPETLSRLATLVVPRLADGCVIDEVGDDGAAFGKVVTLHRDPAIGAVLEEGRRLYPPPQNPRSRVARVIAGGRTEVVERVTPAFVESVAVDERHRELLVGLELGSILFVPLVARERTVGVLTLMRTGDRVYGRRDVALAEEVARRAALYVDNARLYRSVRNEAAARQKVVSMVSHELRNPLSTILLNATAVLDDGAASATRPPLEAVVLAAEQIRHLVQDLADVTRLEAGSLPVERVVFRPCLLLREAGLLLQPLAARGRVRFEARIPGDGLPTVVGDRDRTLQVLGNLVANAVRYTPPDGSIVLAAEPVDGVVRFSVTDTGEGIEPAALAGLFTPLWSGDVPARGMGLPLSRAIVEAQGGRMWAESEPGRGSRFFFTLPVQGE